MKPDGGDKCEFNETRALKNNNSHKIKRSSCVNPVETLPNNGIEGKLEGRGPRMTRNRRMKILAKDVFNGREGRKYLSTIVQKGNRPKRRRGRKHTRNFNLYQTGLLDVEFASREDIDLCILHILF